MSGIRIKALALDLEVSSYDDLQKAVEGLFAIGAQMWPVESAAHDEALGLSQPTVKLLAPPRSKQKPKTKKTSGDETSMSSVILSRLKDGETPTAIAAALKMSVANVYIHRKKLRAAGSLP